MLNRSSDDPICNLSQPHRQILALLIADHPRSAKIMGARLLPEPNCAGSWPESRWHVIHPRRSQAEASHVTVRHFFDWPGRTAQRHCQGRACTVMITDQALLWGLWWCDNGAESAWALLMLISQPMRRGSEGRSPSQTVSSIEARVVDQEFWLQTGCHQGSSARVRQSKRAFRMGLSEENGRHTNRPCNWARECWESWEQRGLL